VRSRGDMLFLVLCAFFVCNVILAEFIGVKVFALGPSLGFAPINWSLFGIQGTLDLTAGVMLWPVVFILTDVINEYFGRRGVRFISWLTVGLIAYAFSFAYLAIHLTPAAWWPAAFADAGVPDQQAAFAALFGQGMWAIGGSVTAFLIAQLIDVTLFHKIRQKTGERWLWARATGSTLISQGIDTFIVLYIMFVLGPQQWPMDRFFAVAMVNYGYKICIALLMTPVIYLAHHALDRWLGSDAAKMKQQAALDS
jgi:queuosine precursor transporter